MAGAMAGSTVLYLAGPSDGLQAVTLTVNNACNLACPHCYLEYSGPQNFVDDAVVDAVLGSECHHVSIVGKEPLLDPASARRTAELIWRCVNAGKSVSLITNGLGLNHLSAEELHRLAWIDVSFDGGPLTYASYRGASYGRIVRNLSRLNALDYFRVNALHTVSTSNIANLDDMIAVDRDFKFERLIFSPYVTTKKHGTANRVNAVGAAQLFAAAAGSRAFMESKKAILLLGEHAFAQCGLDADALRRLVAASGLSSKTTLIDGDPIHLGLLRVTFDGLVLTPLESLDTADYAAHGRALRDSGQLNRLYKHLSHTTCA